MLEIKIAKVRRLQEKIEEQNRALVTMMKERKEEREAAHKGAGQLESIAQGYLLSCAIRYGRRLDGDLEAYEIEIDRTVQTALYDISYGDGREPGTMAVRFKKMGEPKENG